jgi:hypothetical protein
MIKPIFIIEVPYGVCKEHCEIIRDQIKKSFPEYHTLGIVSAYSKEFKYTVLNVKDSITASFNSIDLEGVLSKQIKRNREV